MGWRLTNDSSKVPLSFEPQHALDRVCALVGRGAKAEADGR